MRCEYPAAYILEHAYQPGPWHPLGGPLYRRFEEQFVAGTDLGVAGPGFLPEFAHVVSGDWSILHGVPKEPTSDASLREALSKFDRFAPPAALPASVSVMIAGLTGRTGNFSHATRTWS